MLLWSAVVGSVVSSGPSAGGPSKVRRRGGRVAWCTAPLRDVVAAEEAKVRDWLAVGKGQPHRHSSLHGRGVSDPLSIHPSSPSRAHHAHYTADTALHQSTLAFYPLLYDTNAAVLHSATPHWVAVTLTTRPSSGGVVSETAKRRIGAVRRSITTSTRLAVFIRLHDNAYTCIPFSPLPIAPPMRRPLRRCAALRLSSPHRS